MHIDLTNPAHLFLMSLTFFLWSYLHIYVQEQLDNCNESKWATFALTINIINILMGLTALLGIIAKSL